MNDRTIGTIRMATPGRNNGVFPHQSLTRYFPPDDGTIRDEPLPPCQTNGQLTMVDDEHVVGKHETPTIWSSVLWFVLGLNPYLNEASGHRYHADKYRTQSQRKN